MSTLGERIRFAREQHELLQSDLAKLVGVKSSGVISNWEKDLNKPDAEKIVKLCEVLDVSVSFLLDYYGKTSFEINSFEKEHIKKYRTLDEHGKRLIDLLLDEEYNRCESHMSTTTAATIAQNAFDEEARKIEAALNTTDIENISPFAAEKLARAMRKSKKSAGSRED